jgi:squalene-hopene/tetraprenyl-beta-curcumene cyclase
MSQDLGALDRTIDTLTTRLLERRTPSGHWEGHLASSALSTAVATVALTLDERASGYDHRGLITAGRGWLIAHQNPDGGWGDTVVSFSNLSTTVLCWTALCLGSLSGRLKPAPTDETIERAERWLHAQVGDLSAASLKQAILERYASDRTFSVPILTVLALAGRLGPGAEAWRRVPQLPFELAACPHRWFRWMRLPVVSYALPALVAIGQVRHHHAPTRNPFLRPLRSALRARTLKVAREMQPDSGGYLEAVPLTAFVVMSLISAGAAHHSIVERGLAFLTASARRDGSWPIDTNLATWVTTLSVKALGAGPPSAFAAPRLRRDEKAGPYDCIEWLSAADRRRILRWLLNQHISAEHPFTRAKPGGWAWTDLSGGVPDADDTAGALLAIWNLAGVEQVEAAMAGINWLLDLQNGDGGIPTFCRGWGALPFDRSAPDLTAHALEAWNVWHGAVVVDLQRRMSRAAERAVAYLARRQGPDGSWASLWFGNQHTEGELNLTYGTARVVGALTAPLARRSSSADESHRRGVTWLLCAQNQDGGWGGGSGAPSSLEETGVALDALGRSLVRSPELADAMSRGARWLVEATDEGRRTPACPIGLYFARLWYYEELYPLVFSLKGLSEARARMTLTPS